MYEIKNAEKYQSAKVANNFEVYCSYEEILFLLSLWRMRIFINISIFLMCMGISIVSAQHPQSLDFNTFKVRGLSQTIQWQVPYASAVNCFSTDWQPSYFVSPDSLINVRITGAIYIDSSCYDNDFVGLVMGLKFPNETASQNRHQFYLFDWKREPENAPPAYGGYYASAGSCLAKIEGEIEACPPAFYKYFWAHQLADVFQPIETHYGVPYAWKPNKLYQFEVVYTENYLSVSIDGNVLAEANGDFKSGAFGVYSFAQSLVSYYNVKVYDLSLISANASHDSLFCAQEPITFSVGTEQEPLYANPYVQSYVWNFDDGSPLAYSPQVEHSYQQSGTYEVVLRRIFRDATTDSLCLSIHVLPPSLIIEQPQSVSCSAGDNINFEVNAVEIESYNWYAKMFGDTLWLALKNNGYISGVETNKLSISNVPIAYDNAQYKCEMKGHCGQMLSSEIVDLDIINTPMRIAINAFEHKMCEGDTSFLLLDISGLHQMKSARLRLQYPDSLIEMMGITTEFLSSVSVQMQPEAAGMVDFEVDIVSPVGVQQAVVASVMLRSVAQQTLPIELTWQANDSYVLNVASDTLETVFYNDTLMHYVPLHNDWADSLLLCQNAPLYVDENLFVDYLWNTASTEAYTAVEQEGMYWVQLTDINTCHTTDSVYVNLHPVAESPLSVTLENDIICNSQDSIAFEVIGGMGDYLSYTIGNQKYTDSVAPPYVYAHILNPKQEQMMYVRWHNACGESEAVVVPLHVLEETAPWVSILSDHSSALPNEAVTFTAVAEHEGDNPLYYWYYADKLKQSGVEDTFVTKEINGRDRVMLVLESSRECISQATDTAYYTLKLLSSEEVFVPRVVAKGTAFETFQVFFNDIEASHFQLQIFDLSGKQILSTTDRYVQFDGKGYLKEGNTYVLLYHLQYANSESPQDIKQLKGKLLMKK